MHDEHAEPRVASVGTSDDSEARPGVDGLDLATGLIGLIVDPLARAARPVVHLSAPLRHRLDRVLVPLGQRGKHDREVLVEHLNEVADLVLPRIVAAALARLDLTQLLRDNVDLDVLATDIITSIDLPEIVRVSSASVSSETVQGVRIQAVEADKAIARVVDRVLLRRTARTPTPAATALDESPG
jgi:hypothetical protein